MAHIEIRDRWTDRLIVGGEYESIKDCLEKNRHHDLTGADLRRADLRRADLPGVRLYMADLYMADFSDANLTRADLVGVRGYMARFSRAALSRAALSRADVHMADFSDADLTRADFHLADLSEADLTRADVHLADFSDADLTGVKGLNKYLATSLHFLRDQPGKIRAYKLVANNGDSPMCVQVGGTPINYRIGSTLEVQDANRDESVQCGAGISLATLDWCLRTWRTGYRILIAEFEAADIAAIPTASDGSFRVVRCTIVGEKSLEELGLDHTSPRHAGVRR